MVMESPAVVNPVAKVSYGPITRSVPEKLMGTATDGEPIKKLL
jgi:hypothetical protein